MKRTKTTLNCEKSYSKQRNPPINFLIRKEEEFFLNRMKLVQLMVKERKIYFYQNNLKMDYDFCLCNPRNPKKFLLAHNLHNNSTNMNIEVLYLQRCCCGKFINNDQ